MNKKLPRGFALLSITVLLSIAAGCAHLQRPAGELHQSGEYYDYLQSSFEDYVSVSREWLRVNREFVSSDIDIELDMNAPFILKPSEPTNKAALLVHGLGDSPFYFVDIADMLVDQGFRVEVLLLPGHGSKPADLLLPDYEDWQKIVDHYTKIMSSNYEEVWLGGFSTGANLVTINASRNERIDGLLLFAPGFESKAVWLEQLTPVASLFTDWAYRGVENNQARYRSSPLNAAIAYSDSASALRSTLSRETIDIPSLVVISEADSVINPLAVNQLFEERFTHPNSHLIWYGERPPNSTRNSHHSMKIREYRISTGSHMSPLFNRDNWFYGQNGVKKLCGNGFSKEERQRCENGELVWYSAWGYTEANKLHARLSWNPYFEDMASKVQAITRHGIKN